MTTREAPLERSWTAPTGPPVRQIRRTASASPESERRTVRDGRATVGVFSASGALVEWVLPGGLGRLEGPTLALRYALRDHLGTARVTVDASGAVTEARDYYAFGLEMPGRVYVQGTPTREGFTGHELDVETAMNYAGARYYMPGLGRWASVDPLAEKFAEHSPYNYVINNPIRLVDPTGEEPEDYYFDRKTGRYLGSDNLPTNNIRFVNESDFNTSFRRERSVLAESATVVEPIKPVLMSPIDVSEDYLTGNEVTTDAIANVFTQAMSSVSVVPVGNIRVFGQIGGGNRVAEAESGTNAINVWGLYDNWNDTVNLAAHESSHIHRRHRNVDSRSKERGRQEVQARGDATRDPSYYHTTPSYKNRMRQAIANYANQARTGIGE